LYVKEKLPKMSFAETANKPRKALLNHFKNFCRTAMRGILSIFNGQTHKIISPLRLEKEEKTRKYHIGIKIITEN